MQIKLYGKKLLANKILHCTFCTYETSKKIRTYQILDSQRCYYIGDKLMNSKSLFVVGRAKKRGFHMNDLRGKKVLSTDSIELSDISVQLQGP